MSNLPLDARWRGHERREPVCEFPMQFSNSEYQIGNAPPVLLRPLSVRPRGSGGPDFAGCAQLALDARLRGHERRSRSANSDAVIKQPISNSQSFAARIICQ